MEKLYVVTPAFNDRPSLARLLGELAFLNNRHTQLHVVVVDDGSLEDPVQLRDVEGREFPIQLVSLKRNLGHQRALATGLSQVVLQGDADHIVIMDGDGEDRPQDIPTLLAGLDGGDAAVVVAQRRKRQESQVFQFFYGIYRKLFRLLTAREIRFGNFCALTPKAAVRLVHMEELWMHLPATVINSRLPLRAMEIDRGKRYFGSSRMNLVSLITHGLRSVAVFIETVLTRIIFFCAVVAGSSLVLILVALLIKLLGFATPGWLTIAVGALLGLLIQTATIALVAVLLAINTRNTAGLMPISISGDYIDRVDSVSPSKNA